MHGLYEMHFTFFPITTMLIVYRDLFVFLLTGLLPVAQHLILFALQLGMGYDLREYFINIEELTVEIMIYHLLVATLHLVIVGFFCVFFRDKIAFQYQTFLKQKYMEMQIIEQQQQAIENQYLLIDSYSRFVPDQLLSMLQKQIITEVNLGDADQREMAILFSDIRSFTTLSENLKPQEIFEFINSYLKVMVPIIRKHNGYVDKFLGDGIMALFPLKVEDAIQAGLQMLEGLKDFNKIREKQNLPTIQIGIGIHVGTQMLGIIGESHRLEGTVVSDVVNTASRLEGLTKVFGAPLLVSEETLKSIEDISQFKYRKLGNVKVKGKSKSVSIYEIVPDWKIEKIDAYQNGVLCFELGVDYYQTKKYESTIRMFEKALNFIPEDKASIYYLKECKDKLLNQLNKTNIEEPEIAI